MIARRAPRLRGFGLIELAIAGLMLAVALTVTVQVVSWVATERRAVARRERAIAEVANLMERITARPTEQISTESLASIRLSAPALAMLPGSKLEIKVTNPTDRPNSRKIVIELRWSDRSGQSEAPIRLVAWSYRAEGHR